MNEVEWRIARWRRELEYQSSCRCIGCFPATKPFATLPASHASDSSSLCPLFSVQVTASSSKRQNPNAKATSVYPSHISDLECRAIVPGPISAMAHSNQRNHDEDTNSDNDQQRQADNGNDLSMNDNSANQVPADPSNSPSTNVTSSNDNCGTSTTDNLPPLACWSQHVADATQCGVSSRINTAFHTTTAADTLPNPEERRQLLYTILQDAIRLCDNNDMDGPNNPRQSRSTTTTTSRRRSPHSSHSHDESNEPNSPDTQ